MANDEQVISAKQRKHRSVVLTATLLVLAIAAATVALVTVHHNLTCYSAVQELSNDLQLSKLGTVAESKTADAAGYNDCTDPVLSLRLKGSGVTAKVTARLLDEGFVNTDGVWARGDQSVQVARQSDRTVQVVLHAKD